MKKIPFLGVIMEEEKVEMEEDKVEGVLKWLSQYLYFFSFPFLFF